MPLAKFLLTGLALFGAYELAKYLHQKYFENVSMLPGHNYALVFNYTTDPGLPATAQSLQSALDSQVPGEFKVLTGSLAPGPAVAARQLAMNVEFTPTDGQARPVPLSVFLDAFSNLGIGTVTLASSQDMGVSPTTSGTAAAAATS